ncbi:hypothetical protein KGF57_001879 [Candida theae]|uniref:CTLH domain-containing protein n=1 Tax=Candida theae TaxID=1198502 RepID=A0AAD5BG44_9ASCO|nr:uncharacterized protein KGF57_001879 [Candida theae]KAI5960732.1 hypothetical protein KGF57_001879 [Candida theae]
MSDFHGTIQKRHIDQLVLEYLIQEGYEEGALAFAEELNVDLEPQSKPQLIPTTNGDQASVTSSGQHSRQQTLKGNLQNLSKLPDHEFSDVILNYYSSSSSSSSSNSNSNNSYNNNNNNNNNSNNNNDTSGNHNSYANTPSIYNRNAKFTSGYSTISQRQEIKRLILNGEITSAITKISRWFPIILDSNNLLHFKLLRLNLIEMIRNHKFSSHSESDERKFLNDILTFVRQNLINKISNSHKLLKELEFTMSLLCFRFDPLVSDLEDQKELPLELRNFFNKNIRNQVFRLVNKEILDMYEVKSLSDYDKGYDNDDLIDELRLKIEYGNETPPMGGGDAGIYDSSPKPIVYTGPAYESFSFENTANIQDDMDEFESDFEDLEEGEQEDEGRGWDQLVDVNPGQSIAKTSPSEVYKGEKVIRKDASSKNEDEVESLLGLAMESKLESLVKLFVLTEKKRQSFESSPSRKTFEIKEGSSIL